MTSDVEAAELPEWINLGALTTPEEISQRQMLVLRGTQLVPALAAWIADAAPLADRPPLLEVVGVTRELIYFHMGITALAETVDRFRELVAVFEASGAELDNRLDKLRVERAGDHRAETPDVDDLFGREPDERGVSGHDDQFGAIAEGSSGRFGPIAEGSSGRWRHRSRPSD
jgi:hypothetical protein